MFSKQVENTVEKRNCWLRAISPFPTVFSTELYCRHIKTRACLGKGKFFPKQQNLDSSKLNEFADDKFKFDKNGRKFSKEVDNTVGREEISCYQQFLLFP